MKNLKPIEVKAFLPAKDFELSKKFYLDMGFQLGSDEQGVAYFYLENCSFLLQNFYQEQFANNLMMHLLVEDAFAWHDQLVEGNLVKKYGIQMSEVVEQPWNMLDFVIGDPSGVLWRIGQNIGTTD